jgi:membrane-bound ClpP family serine protease
MNFVNALNKINSQVLAVVLVVLGLVALVIADHSHISAVVTGLVGVAGSITGGALMMFKSEKKDPESGGSQQSKT